MPEDIELGVTLVPDESAIENLEDREIGAGPADEGPGLGPTARSQQQGAVAGGFRTALKATGLLAILSGLKPLTATVGAILGVISRRLVPLFEDVAEFIRPAVQNVNRIVEAPGTFTENIGRGVSQFEEDPNRQFLRFLGVDEENIRGSERTGENQGILDGAQSLGELIFGSGTPDQSGEADKKKFTEKVQDTTRDKLGGGK